MNKGKIIRLFVIAFVFLCLTTLTGQQSNRETHQLFMMLGGIILFGLLLDNIWITLFLWWTVLLYGLSGCTLGSVYVTNVFFGCVLYFITKVSFKREHINTFINAVLWLLVINIAYGTIQVLGWDWIFSGHETIRGGIAEAYNRAIPFGCANSPNGFMGNTGIMSSLIALCIPLALTRQSKMSYYVTAAMFYPLWVLRSFTNVIAGIVAIMFILFFRLPRKIWFVVCIALLIFATIFVVFKDLPGSERLQAWKLMLHDTMVHPVKGWGLDSFRKMTDGKQHVYAKNIQRDSGGKILEFGSWDNPHNLLISLAFEWGFMGWFLLIGFLRFLGLRFYKSIKSSNTLGLAGFIIVLFIVSMGHFPLFLARFCVFVIPAVALFDISTK